MHKIIFIGLLICANHLKAQYKVTFYINQFPSYHTANSNVYIAGPFNNWNPCSEAYRLQKDSIVIHVQKGLLEYKFTRGNWEKAEAVEGGLPMENRRAQIENDTIIDVTIQHWSDHFSGMKKKSTASKNVHIIDTAFYMPELARHRRIWIYLPESYATSRKKYPVLYMQDGQNLFDEATAFAGEWGIDETLDTLGPNYKEAIVVAIDNGGEKRMNEYSPYNMPEYGKGEGDRYIDFLVHTLKPYIDKNYRSRKSRKQTFIAGSSMGGLISFYAILKYPKVFGGAGIFSPAFWIAPDIKNDIKEHGKKVKGKIYFYAGKQESEHMIPDMLAIFEQLHQLSRAEMKTVIRAEGKHNEAAWRQEFPLFFKWIMVSRIP